MKLMNELDSCPNESTFGILTSTEAKGAQFMLYDTVPLTFFFPFLSSGRSARGRKPLLLNWFAAWLTTIVIAIQLGGVTRSRIFL